MAAVGSWLMAKSKGGRWLLRIDDLDTPRQIPGMVDDILATLESFGLVWDGEISRQSRNIDAYQEAFERLAKKGWLYPCCCSRSEIAHAASAPRPEDDGLPYPGTCRRGMREGGVIRSWRARMPDEELCFHDLRKGLVCQNLFRNYGDIALRRGDGVFTYQLAVVVDDYLTGVTQVVRGEDLLPSTLRQIHLQQLLNYPRPEYCHLPLVTGPGGAKLSKRDNLVSHHMGNLRGKEGALLPAVLRFLGHSPPLELAGAGCGEILQWGLESFDIKRIPATGGELVIDRL